MQLPILSQGLPLSWVVAIGMPLINAANLILLARTRRFARYVAILAVTILVFGGAVEVSLGGLAGSSASIVFAFLAPVLALLGLGPRRALPW